ncbi:hypothetical protein K1T71_014227 [Dendrolimus kikuchii]|uniref:Uncharacterized protein n=1 Tax=Dendrolimus kikuchii TaxID=765133 RepID=A0ACC1CFG3_9NEOP|nr:hypothetical protein K1T71_014227 [Dendrolimus kikuchii]
MADLDDFFAKKDRKKSKAVKKFATTDELAKKLEDPKQKTDVRPKKERPAVEGEEAGRGGEEEEWKEYEEPVKDYTGLKIQVLQGDNGAQEAGRDSASEDTAPESGKVKGPWNKSAPEAEAPPPPPVVEEKPREQKPAVYVPPVSRQRAVEPQVRRNQAVKNCLNLTCLPERVIYGSGWDTGVAGGGKLGSGAAAGGVGVITGGVGVRTS